MADTIEKIYRGDRGDDNALTAAILSNNRRDDGYNNWMNNPFAYLMFLAFTRNGFGNDNNNAALEAIRTQMQDNQNSSLIMSALGDGFNRNDFALSQLAQNLNVDFNTLQKCCCAGQDNTQRIIDALNTHWKDEQAREIQDLKAQISQLKQTDAIIARLQGNGCGCNNGVVVSKIGALC